MVAIDQRNQEGRQSIRSSRKSKSSKCSRSSISSYRAKAVEAKAKHAELKTRIAYLDTVEATRKESERAKLMTEYLVAAAASKVYEQAVKEEDEQYLGSNDPDEKEYIVEKSNVIPLTPLVQQDNTCIEEMSLATKASQEFNQVELSNETKKIISTLNSEAREYVAPITHVLPKIAIDSDNRNEQCKARYVDHSIKPNYEEARSQLNWQTPQFLSHPANVSPSEPRAAFWEKMEMRMSSTTTSTYSI